MLELCLSLDCITAAATPIAVAETRARFGTGDVRDTGSHRPTSRSLTLLQILHQILRRTQRKRENRNRSSFIRAIRKHAGIAHV